MGWIEIFLSPLLKIDVGETLFTFLFPEDRLGCKQNCHLYVSVIAPRQDFDCILRGRLVGTAPNVLKSIYEDDDSGCVLMSM